jgi:hypothetical protein
VQNLLFNLKNRSNFSLWALLLATLTIFAGCGSGPTTPASTTTTTATAPTITIVLTDPSSGATVTSVSSGASATVKATVRDATGAVVPSTVVTFSTTSAASMTPTSGTALTDSTGVATITLTGGATAGASTITASAQVGSTAVEGSIGYSVGATSVTISAPVFGISPLSAFGTTSVTATVTGGGTGSQTVNFTSVCNGNGKAILSTGISTVSGVAVSSYRDNGCAGTDTITATVNGGLATSSANLTVTAPTTGSIQYISSTPTNISLKGTGGIEVSQVVFKVIDTGGNPLSGKTVTFALSTNVGGITLTSLSATSGSDGTVVTGVNSGTVSTPVRVTATTEVSAGVSRSTQSNQLTISTGIPAQDRFSLSATLFNIEGLNYDGATTVLTASLADHFGNPVPNNTVVNFYSEASRVDGSCFTTNGTCSATFTTQGTTPSDGRITVLAYVVGEESFRDLNNNGTVDNAAEMIDVNGAPSDMGDPYLDIDESGTRDANETFININSSSTYMGADGKYNGVLCTANATICSSQKSIYVRDSLVIVLSGSTGAGTAITLSGPIDLNTGGALAGCGIQQDISFNVADENGNPLPAGTTITVATTNGTLSTNSTTIVVGNSNQKSPVYIISISGDGTVSNGVCTDNTPSGTLTVTVKSPKGDTVSESVRVDN